MFGSKINFFEDHNDDIFGIPSNTSSNLSNIFGVTMTSEQDSNTTLKYIPPKQKPEPKTNENQQEKSDWTIAIAKVVSAYKLINNENVSQGKVGLALLKSIKEENRIIVYRTKNQVLSTTTLSLDYKIYIKHEYLQFRDDNQQFWSISFTENDRELYLKEIKHKCQIINNEISDKQSLSQTKQNKNEAVDETPPTKASILSRLAKMGTPLPQMISTTEVSDSSDTDEKPQVFPRRTLNKVLKNTNQDIIPSAMTMTSAPLVSSNLVPYHPNTLQDSGLNVFFSENRIHNTEVRMNLSKLESKIEKVLDKIDFLNMSKTTSVIPHVDREDELLNMEEKLLELKRENRHLRMRNKELERSNDNAANSSTLNSESIDKLNEKIEILKIEDKENKEINNRHRDSIETHKKLLDKKDNEILELQTKNTLILKQQQDCTDQTISEHNLAIEKITVESLSYQEYIKKLEKEIEDKSIELSKLNEKPSVDTIVKEVMNNLYQKLHAQLTEKETFSQLEVLKLTGNLIKTETVAALSKSF